MDWTMLFWAGIVFVIAIPIIPFPTDDKWECYDVTEEDEND